jgi:hypothetical protein
MNKRKTSFRMAGPWADISHQDFPNVTHFCYILNRDSQGDDFRKGNESLLHDDDDDDDDERECNSEN